jgi:carbonic anhydrase
MNKILTLTTISLTTLFLTTANAEVAHAKKDATEHKTAHWSYDGDTGPSHWGELKEEFKTCSQGKMQTPINIVPSKDVELKALALNYSTPASSIIDNGHTVQVNIKEGSTLNIERVDYELKQFHFHTPSENNIKGASFPLEAHFVHATKDGKLAVVAVMFKEGKENPTLAKIWSKFPAKRGEKVDFTLSADDVKSLMPENKDYYEFIGSLTTPPCSEGVKWHVYKTPLEISKDQVTKFFNVFKHSNNRPIQDTNKRTIKE